MKPPSAASILLACIPFLGTCLSVPLWDRIYPVVLGLPFNFFWLVSWLFVSPLFIWGAYRLETRRERESNTSGPGAES